MYFLKQSPGGDSCCVRVAVTSSVSQRRVRQGMTLYRFSATDGESRVLVTLFNNPYAVSGIEKGSTCLLFGQVRGQFPRYEMTAPVIEPAAGGERIRPVYPQTEGLSSRVIEKTVAQALDTVGDWMDEDPLPAEIRQEKY